MSMQNRQPENKLRLLLQPLNQQMKLLFQKPNLMTEPLGHTIFSITVCAVSRPAWS
jgi:hypothetical protein